MGRKRRRPRGRVRRAGKRSRSDPSHDEYVVGCVLEELLRGVEVLSVLLPHSSCDDCVDVLPPCCCATDSYGGWDVVLPEVCWVCRAAWSGCSACARRNAAGVQVAFAKGGRRLMAQMRARPVTPLQGCHRAIVAHTVCEILLV